MGSKTKIDWADATWNPVTGCKHGCPYCYARNIAMRFGVQYSEWNTECGHDWDVFDGTGENHELTEPSMRQWKNGKVTKAPYPYCFDPTLHLYRMDEPKHWKQPKTIFVCSMADLFGEWVPDSWIQKVFDACEAAPQHRYLFLTKNPKRMMRMAAAMEVKKHPGQYSNEDELAGVLPLPKHDNWWFGSTVDNKKALRFQWHGYNSFTSIEPIMEYLNLGLGSFGSDKWVIIGAETGNRIGKVIPQREWIDNVLEAASITRMKVFMKESLRELMGEDFKQEFPWDENGN